MDKYFYFLLSNMGQDQSQLLLFGGAKKRKQNEDGSSSNKKANVKKHARSVKLADLRVEVETFLNQHHDGQEITNAIAKYLTTNFGLWNPKSSVPFELRKKSTDQSTVAYYEVDPSHIRRQGVLRRQAHHAT